MSASVDRPHVAGWIESYERAWRTPGTDQLRELFTEEASYRQSPYQEPAVGLEAIGRMWEAERASPDEPFTMTSELVAVEGQTAVARIEVRYEAPRAQEYRDLWIMRFAGDGRCQAFEEWPFWPERSHTARELG